MPPHPLMDPPPPLQGDIRPSPIRDAESHVQDLERRLARARAHLDFLKSNDDCLASSSLSPAILFRPADPPPHHFLLLLADSALPLGSFAFSSGLESFLAHTRHRRIRDPLAAFLPLSISSFASAALPFCLAAHRAPSTLGRLDDELDAAVPCAVGRRASIAQGRALLSLWERSFAPSAAAGSVAADAEAADALASLSCLLRSSFFSSPAPAPSSGPAPLPLSEKGEGGGQRSNWDLPPLGHAHLAPIFGVVARALGLSAREAAHILMLGHARAVVSAAVRAGVLGPYQAQRVLAGGGLADALARAVEREWDVHVEAAGQRVVMLDLWMGRHELLYSRIFNS